MIWINGRAFVSYDKLECYKYGFFSTGVCGHDRNQSILAEKLLTDEDRFYETCIRLLDEWPITSVCNLSNKEINRRAWLGQSSSFFLYSCCDACTKKAWNRLTREQQDRANNVADRVIKEWETIYENEICQTQRFQLELVY